MTSSIATLPFLGPRVGPVTIGTGSGRQMPSVANGGGLWGDDGSAGGGGAHAGVGGGGALCAGAGGGTGDGRHSLGSDEPPAVLVAAAGAATATAAPQWLHVSPSPNSRYSQ